MGLFDEEAGIFRLIYRNRMTAWMLQGRYPLPATCVCFCGQREAGSGFLPNVEIIPGQILSSIIGIK